MSVRSRTSDQPEATPQDRLAALPPATTRGDDGRAKALGEDYRRHADWLRRRLALRFGHRAIEADDVVQEAYLRFDRYPADARSLHARALLLRIAGNLIRDEFRRRRRRREDHRASIDDSAVSHDAAMRVAADQEERLLLKQLVLNLPPRIREVFLLSRFSALTHAEIAERLGISVKTVEWRIGRALAICTASLQD